MKLLSRVLYWLNNIGNPFTQEDYQHPCRIFAYDSYTGHYGCMIEYPDSPLCGPVVLWACPQFVDKHPNHYFDKQYREF